MTVTLCFGKCISVSLTPKDVEKNSWRGKEKEGGSSGAPFAHGANLVSD